MKTYQSSKVKIILNLTEGSDSILLDVLPKIVIKNTDLGTFWNGTALQADYIELDMTWDSVMNYYYYQNVNITTTGYYETLIISNDTLYGFRQEEQFKVIVADDIWAQDISTYTTTGTAGDQLNDVTAQTVGTVMAAAVWDESTADHEIEGTYGHELATKSDIAASTSTSFTTATTGTIIYGNLASGLYTNTLVRDNIFWVIDEDITTGLTVEFTFNIPENNRAGVVNIFGHYDGGGSPHYMELWIWNVETSSWEQLHERFMNSENNDSEYSHQYWERHIDHLNNNEVKFRLIHNTTTYNASHNLSLDYVAVSSIEVITAEDIADAVWDEASTEHTISGSTGDQLTLTRKLGTNLAIISEDWQTITIYDDDQVTPLHIYTLSSDKRIRTPS